MQKWSKQNLSVIITLIGICCAGVATAAIMQSDIGKLNIEVFGKDSRESQSVRLVRLETKVDYIIEILKNAQFQ